MPCVAAVAWRWAYGAAPLLNLQLRWESVYSVEFRVWGLRVCGLGFRVESVGYGITMRQISIYSELQGMNYLVVDFLCLGGAQGVLSLGDTDKAKVEPLRDASHPGLFIRLVLRLQGFWCLGFRAYTSVIRFIRFRKGKGFGV